MSLKPLYEKVLFFKSKVSLGEKVPKGQSGRRLVISDIHGCYLTFKALIEKIALTTDDQLFLLGDYINKGPNSSGVLNVIMALQKNDYKIFPLMGNHEQMLLDNAYKDREILKWGFEQDNASDLLNYQGSVRERYINLLQGMPYFYELDNFFLVHAGFNFRSKDPFANYYDMVWIRDLGEVDHAVLNNRRIVHGHTPTGLSEILQKIDQRESVIPLDNGCVFAEPGNDEFGNLLCLDLDSMEVLVQRNIDIQNG